MGNPKKGSHHQRHPHGGFDHLVTVGRGFGPIAVAVLLHIGSLRVLHKRKGQIPLNA